MAIDKTHRVPRSKAAHKASIEFHLIFLISFLFMLVATVLERMMPWTWLRKGDEVEVQDRRSVIARAWGAAQTCTTYAFMG